MMNKRLFSSDRVKLLAATLFVAAAALALYGCNQANAGKTAAPAAAPTGPTGPVQVVLADGSSLDARLSKLEENIANAVGKQTQQALSQQRLIDFADMPAPVRLFDLSKLDGVSVTGPKDAVITLIEFSDFQCPYCARMAKFLDQLMKERPGKIRLIFVDRPLNNNYRDGYPFHPYAMTAHEAAAEARAQGKFWEMYDYLFTNQAQIIPHGRPSSQEDYDKSLAEFRETLVKAAGELGLDQAKMRTALEKQTHKDQIDRNNQLAQSMGINSTPTVYVDAFMSMSSPNLVMKLIDEAVELK